MPRKAPDHHRLGTRNEYEMGASRLFRKLSSQSMVPIKTSSFIPGFPAECPMTEVVGAATDEGDCAGEEGVPILTSVGM